MQAAQELPGIFLNWSHQVVCDAIWKLLFFVSCVCYFSFFPNTHVRDPILLSSKYFVLSIPIKTFRKLKYLGLLIPNKSKVKRQMVCGLFRQPVKTNCAFIGGYWGSTWDTMQYFWLTDNENGAFSWGCNTSRFRVAMHALALHEKWMPYIQQAEFWQINVKRHSLPPENLIHTTEAHRQSHFTPISMSAPPSASRQACLNQCPLLTEIYAN